MKLAVLVGSWRADSYNQRLAEIFCQGLAKDVEVSWIDISILPHFNQDDEGQLPKSVQTMKAQIDEADGVLVVTPEYNRSLPGALKNALDWASRPSGESVWAGKPVGVMGASIGQFGTLAAQADVRRILAHMDALVMPQPQVLVGLSSKRLTGEVDEKTLQVVAGYREALLAWIEQRP